LVGDYYLDGDGQSVPLATKGGIVGALDALANHQLGNRHDADATRRHAASLRRSLSLSLALSLPCTRTTR